MLVQHKKTKEEHWLSVEEWNRLKELNMQGSYKVIDNQDLIAGKVDIRPEDIEVFQIKIEPEKKKKKVIKKDNE